MTTDNQQTTSEGFLAGVHDDWQVDRAKTAVKQMTSLVDPDRYVGDLISLEYGSANILIHDYRKSIVDGIPHGCLLLATRITPEEPEITDPTYERMALILLRVTGGVPLRSDIDVEKARLEAVKRAHDTGQNYDESAHTDQFTLDMLRYAGAKCRVLGTFTMYQENPPQGEWRIHFGGDLDNFYAGQGMKIYKPHSDALRRIVNYRGSDEVKVTPTRIGRVRYSAAVKRDTPESVPVEITADDMIAQRTALFGMTRSGKSNTTKTIAAAIFKLRTQSGGQRVGQLIFDPNGEYANDNPQDQGCLRNIQYEVVGAEGQVQTYGSYEHPNDPDRNITKFNFYGNQEPATFQTDIEGVRASLEPLYQGEQIINDALAEESGGYISAFIAADVFGGNDTLSQGEYVRLRRRLFFYRAILAEAGFDPPTWFADARGLFNQDIRDLMNSETALAQYVPLLTQGNMSWDLAGSFSRAFSDWIKGQPFRNYDTGYAPKVKAREGTGATRISSVSFAYTTTHGASA